MKIVSISKGLGFKVSRGFFTWSFPTTLTVDVEISNEGDLEKARKKLNKMLNEILEKDIEEMKVRDPKFSTALDVVDLDFENLEKSTARQKDLKMRLRRHNDESAR